MSTLLPPLLPIVRSALHNRTGIGLVLSVAGWSTLWAQPLLDLFVIPSAVAAVAFFAGLVVGARPPSIRKSPPSPEGVDQ